MKSHIDHIIYTAFTVGGMATLGFALNMCASMTAAKTFTVAEEIAQAACVVANQDLPSIPAIQTACGLTNELIPLIQTIVNALGKGKPPVSQDGGK